MQEKFKIIEAYQETKSIPATAAKCHCTPRVAKRWVTRFDATNSVDTTVKTGRKPKISIKLASKILELLLQGKYGGATGVARFLRDKGYLSTVVSKSTIIRHARMAARRANDQLLIRRGLPKKGLTEATKKKRLLFAKSNLKTCWDMVMFSDRKRFYHRFPGSKVEFTRYYLKSQKLEEEEGIFQPTNPNCLNVYVGITRSGPTKVHVVAGTTGYKHAHMNKKGQKARNITKGQYKQVVVKTLVKGGNKLFKGRSWILQQDNDPCHKVALEVLPKSKSLRAPTIQVLPAWPPNSPDLNSIENFWSYIERRVIKRGCKTFKSFVKCVKAEISSISTKRLEYLGMLFDSMPKRLADVIKNKGGKTGY